MSDADWYWDEKTQHWKRTEAYLRGNRFLATQRKIAQNGRPVTKGRKIDPWYVHVKDFQEYIILWCNAYDMDHFDGSFNMLGHRTDVDPKTVQRIFVGELKIVSYRIMDALMTDIGLSHKVQDIPVYSRKGKLPVPPPNLYFED